MQAVSYPIDTNIVNNSTGIALPLGYADPRSRDGMVAVGTATEIMTPRVGVLRFLILIALFVIGCAELRPLGKRPVIGASAISLSRESIRDCNCANGAVSGIARKGREGEGRAVAGPPLGTAPACHREREDQREDACSEELDPAAMPCARPRSSRSLSCFHGSPIGAPRSSIERGFRRAGWRPV